MVMTIITYHLLNWTQCLCKTHLNYIVNLHQSQLSYQHISWQSKFQFVHSSNSYTCIGPKQFKLLHDFVSDKAIANRTTQHDEWWYLYLVLARSATSSLASHRLELATDIDLMDASLAPFLSPFPAFPPPFFLQGNHSGRCMNVIAATCDLNHIMTSCTHFGERPSLDDIAEMKDGYVRWLRAIADTIWWSVKY